MLKIDIEKSTARSTRMLCQCDCGKIKSVLSGNLLNGTSRSCGCFARENASMLQTKHGLHKSQVYKAWRSMFARCSKNSRVYKHYGARGISVCNEWKSFEPFFEYMGHPPSPQHSLDRINNDAGYEPGNCRWATKSEQCKNQRRAVFIEIAGINLCITDWAERLKMSRMTLYGRQYRGMSAKEILRPFTC